MTNSDKKTLESRINELLPNYNCGACGFKRCDSFTESVLLGDDIKKCPFLLKDDFKSNFEELTSLLNQNKDLIAKNIKKSETRGNGCCSTNGELTGLIDGYEADFLLDPLKNEHSCRETLLITSPLAKDLKIGDYIQYRPLACPLPHFAKIIDISHGMHVIHIEGPCHRVTGEKKDYVNVGVALIMAFEGMVSKGKMPEVGKTVKFIPTHCMMQKVHSGVVVEAEGDRVLIEGIDLKVW
ncbi:putative Fe-S cluster-containing protein [Methanococcus voltae]|uniref:Putative Fe-S cluster-containing protein n=1 Tax=Methanococcus voltae TaxID=2188 RepID=A0A8J7RLV5_METVO|nr:(Fe-S)-binding protein [Methanococcus voltae]MBP2200644.1 putative Fe-S cluster-containing protein [Methanococcus voltae]